MQGFLLRVVGFPDITPPYIHPLLRGWRKWRIVAVLVCNVSAVVVTGVVLVLYFLYVHRFNPHDAAYVVVFCVQFPVFASCEAPDGPYASLPRPYASRLLPLPRLLLLPLSPCPLVTS